ncbi:hypothetical protein H6F32_12725 [Anabaena sp. FACHB-1237]|uniref:hypothetical protein n=1 Tax=Anabaena sp. FACHB-1237 TaxID=2692769 RepID=UPI001680C406|nr:hypothetical protein [Anabaena sp. FACHB-1237]MBD2138432.1 hypothetical protein [Anabaena sp. FACHB-1237]
MNHREQRQEPDNLLIAQELEELEADLQHLKQRLGQVQADKEQKAQWQQELQNLQQNREQTPEIKADITRIKEQLEAIEINLESQLISWNSIKKPFWQAVRFGGLGVIMGWLLKSWVG